MKEKMEINFYTYNVQPLVKSIAIGCRDLVSTYLLMCEFCCHDIHGLEDKNQELSTLVVFNVL